MQNFNDFKSDIFRFSEILWSLETITYIPLEIEHVCLLFTVFENPEIFRCRCFPKLKLADFRIFLKQGIRREKEQFQLKYHL